jgi:hypothetical protein
MRMQIMMTTLTSWNGADDVNFKTARAVAAARLNDGKNWWWRATNNDNKNDDTTCFKNNKRNALKEELWLNDLQGDAYRIRKRMKKQTQWIHTSFWIWCSFFISLSITAQLILKLRRTCYSCWYYRVLKETERIILVQPLEKQIASFCSTTWATHYLESYIGRFYILENALCRYRRQSM